MSTLNRDALRSKLKEGPAAVVNEARRLGYVRGRFDNGLEVIATPDCTDYIFAPSYTMRQSREFFAAWELMPVEEMGK